MRLIRGLHNLKFFQQELSSGSVVTLGDFDGVHLGHQQLINRVNQLGKEKNLPSLVMIFEPLPAEFFLQDKAPVRLMNLREKLRCLANLDVDFVLCVNFNAKFAELNAQKFIEEVLVQGLNLKHLVIGDDFKFGKNRTGNFALLKEQGKKLGFEIESTPTCSLEDTRISSTRIREVLAQSNFAQADLDLANSLLGKSFSFAGRVIHGKKLGRQLGFPTLNINPKRLSMPVNGVFAVKVYGLQEEAVFGVANLGIRPTVNGNQPAIEVHLFNWNKMVYGAHVTVELASFIRPEMKFNGLDELKAQIDKDASRARKFFNI